MRICFLPGREATYIRTRVLQETLKKLNIEYFDCSCPEKHFYRYFYSFLKFLRFLPKSECVIVGFCAQPLVLFARLFTKKPIIMDAYISIFETLAIERKKFGPQSMFAKWTRWLDRKAFDLSDLVLLDTDAHINYFIQEYGVDKKKIHKFIASCANLNDAKRTVQTNKPPVILHYGEFQSLHGSIFIIRCAKYIPNARFILIGQGRDLKACQLEVKNLKLDNITFYPFIPYQELMNHIVNADICLGIFGGTLKANIVIPNKVYDYLSLGRATITQKSSAVQELFTDGEDLILCKEKNAESIADKIKILLDDSSLRDRIAQQGKNTFDEKCSIDALSSAMQNIINEIKPLIRVKT